MINKKHGLFVFSILLQLPLHIFFQGFFLVNLKFGFLVVGVERDTGAIVKFCIHM
jgi:hypothetical protein